MAKRKATEGITAVIESPVAATPKSKEPKLCQCGCGRETQAKFAPGHDATLKSMLLGRLDGGDSAAAVELIERGWYTAERLEARQLKRADRQIARDARAAAKAAKEVSGAVV